MHFTISEHFQLAQVHFVYTLICPFVQGSCNVFAFDFSNGNGNDSDSHLPLKCTLNGRLRMQAPKMFKQIEKNAHKICLCQFTQQRQRQWRRRGRRRRRRPL